MALAICHAKLTLFAEFKAMCAKLVHYGKNKLELFVMIFSFVYFCLHEPVGILFACQACSLSLMVRSEENTNLKILLQ